MTSPVTLSIILWLVYIGIFIWLARTYLCDSTRLLKTKLYNQAVGQSVRNNQVYSFESMPTGGYILTSDADGNITRVSNTDFMNDLSGYLDEIKKGAKGGKGIQGFKGKNGPPGAPGQDQLPGLPGATGRTDLVVVPNKYYRILGKRRDYNERVTCNGRCSLENTGDKFKFQHR